MPPKNRRKPTSTKHSLEDGPFETSQSTATFQNLQYTDSSSESKSILKRKSHNLKKYCPKKSKNHKKNRKKNRKKNHKRKHKRKHKRNHKKPKHNRSIGHKAPPCEKKSKKSH